MSISLYLGRKIDLDWEDFFYKSKVITVAIRLSPFFSGKTPKMAGGNKNKLSREEELLLQDFSRNVSTKSSALFYGNALIVSAIPICELLNRQRVRLKNYHFTCCAGVCMCDVDTGKGVCIHADLCSVFNLSSADTCSHNNYTARIRFICIVSLG